MLILGFTGTQVGMTENQKYMFRDFVDRHQPAEFHHGDCVGADAEAHAIVRSCVPCCVIILHPPENQSKRAWCDADVSMRSKPYLERNHDIVDSCHNVVACPGQATEVLRSGTWATIRYARKQAKQLVIFLP